MTAKPGALDAIPDQTCLNWIAMERRGPIPAWTIMPSVHVAYCRTNGGTVSPYLCPRCSRSVDWKYRSALARLDSRAGGR